MRRLVFIVLRHMGGLEEPCDLLKLQTAKHVYLFSTSLSLWRRSGQITGQIKSTIKELHFLHFILV